MQEQTAFRYRDHSAQDHAAYVLFVGVVLVFASLLTGVWGIAALLHANWLHENDLWAGNATAWGIVHLGIATLQGISGLLVIFNRPSGFFLAIAMTLFAIAGHVAVITAYPLLSIVAILVDVGLIAVLWAYRPRR